MTDVWAVVHAERRALIADLEGLDEQQWRTPSLCAEWTVHDVLAHLLAAAKGTVLGFIKDMLQARFDFHRTNELGIAREKADDPRDTLDSFRAVVDRTSSPPAPRATRLIEMIVHGEDIRRPLGMTREYPPAAVTESLLSQVSTSASIGGGKTLVAGLSLVATDAELTVGSGEKVQGSSLSLLLAASGRPAALPDLTGPGVEVLADRIGGESA